MGRNIIPFLLNFPWTCVGVLTAILSGARAVRFMASAPALVVRVKSFWWYSLMSRSVRAMTYGHVILLRQEGGEMFLEHELVHIEQFKRFPFTFPLLYFGDSILHGYKNNRFEVEAYRL